MKRLLIFVLLVFVVGCGSAPDYNASLQTYKTEKELHDEMVVNRDAQLAEIDGLITTCSDLQFIAQNQIEKSEADAQMKRAEDTRKNKEAEWKAQIDAQFERVNKAKEILDEAEAARD